MCSQLFQHLNVMEGAKSPHVPLSLSRKSTWASWTLHWTYSPTPVCQEFFIFLLLFLGTRPEYGILYLPFLEHLLNMSESTICMVNPLQATQS